MIALLSWMSYDSSSVGWVMIALQVDELW